MAESEGIKIKEKKVASNIAWNTIGSLFYFACQWLLSVVVVRLSSGYENAGILSLAMSITNVFSTIALFNVRNFQVSDSYREYSATEYSVHRFITCGIAFFGCAVFVLVNSYNAYVAFSIIGFMAIKLVEAYADVLHGMAQIKWRLDIAGKSYIIRGVLQLGTFILVQYLTENLALSIITMAASNIVVLILYDLRVIRRLSPFLLFEKGVKIKSLSAKCLPLFVYGLCVNSIVSSARYFIELMHGEEVLGYFATVSSIAVLVQAMVTLIFNPLLGLFDEAHKAGKRGEVGKLLVKLIILLIGITAVAMGAIFLLGDFFMGLIFGKEILPYVYLLYPTVIASCITAFVWLMGMLLVVIRDSLTLMLGAVAGISLSIVLSLVLIPKSCYDGANISVIASLSVVALIYIVRFLFYLLGKNDTLVCEQEKE